MLATASSTVSLAYKTSDIPVVIVFLLNNPPNGAK